MAAALEDRPHVLERGTLARFGRGNLGRRLRGREAERVYATTARAAGQTNRAPMLAQALIEYPVARASIMFDAATKQGARDTTVVVGTQGTIRSEGPDLNHQRVTFYTAGGVAEPVLEGEWFRNGFVGTMAELLCAVEQDREPYNGARDAMRGLSLCFAAVASAESGEAAVPVKRFVETFKARNKV